MGYSKNYIMYWGFYSYYSTMFSPNSVHKLKKNFLQKLGNLHYIFSFFSRDCLIFIRILCSALSIAFGLFPICSAI